MSKFARTAGSPTELASMGSDALLKRCRDQQPDASHERFCMELFRRAIAGEEPDCWGVLYRHYKRLVGHWAVRYAQRMGRHIDDLDSIVVDALMTFWDAYTLDKFKRAQGLAPVLTYLRACTATAVQNAIRQQIRDDNHQDGRHLAAFADLELSPEHQPEAIFARHLEAQQLWRIVQDSCHDEKDLLLAELCFSMDLKPSEVMEHYAGAFAGVDEVYARLRNLRNRLRRNDNLRQLWTKND